MKQVFAVVVIGMVMLAGCSSDEGLLATQSSDSGLTATLASSSSHASGGEYDVTITNMSHSQPFSPGVIVTHDDTASLFAVGETASEGVRLIAENGDPTTALSELDGAPGVSHVVNTGAAVHRKGGPGPDQLTVRVMADPGAGYLSMSIMLICTNDGFVGLNSVKLPKGPETAVYFPDGYDAGTEANDELATSIVDPCGGIGPVAMPPDGSNDRTATSDVIAKHPGIAGVGDLDAKAHNWRNKVARVTIKRVR